MSPCRFLRSLWSPVSSFNGGALFVDAGVTLLAFDSSWKDNLALKCGGAVNAYFHQTSAHFERCLFHNNTALQDGGAV